jgi:hypothetical protein
MQPQFQFPFHPMAIPFVFPDQCTNILNYLAQVEEALGWYVYIAACATIMSEHDPDFKKVRRCSYC